ncbi:CAMK protein kinase [Paracoccidioides brasiliensis Pb18]|uniref:CAMK protein kinase n=1 Tax=Paracoccidioides brasiliensis (strain Pb18) TaxID=502780 RepID=A0A0A0HUK7_PARBD|nr:CAMK protein kinase [Paracoccidioides brasiliensis Pb18]KGM91691.1 CAMK protein kinase [Paracoccidioides brasiliensis Pb18]
MHRLPPLPVIPVIELPYCQNELTPRTLFPADPHPSPDGRMPPLYAPTSTPSSSLLDSTGSQRPSYTSTPEDEDSARPEQDRSNMGSNYTSTTSPPIDTLHSSQNHDLTSLPRTPSLQICTDLPTICPSVVPSSDISREPSISLRASTSTTSLPRRAPSIRNALTAAHSCAGSISPSSVISSPQLAALTDITPLPSPILPGCPPWRSGTIHPPSRTPSTSSRSRSTFSIRRIGSSEGVHRSSSTRRHVSGGLAPESQPSDLEPASEHTRQNDQSLNQSLSDDSQEAPHLPLPHKSSLPNAIPHNGALSHQEIIGRTNMHREEYLAVQRGIALPPLVCPPTPPHSARSSYDSSDTDVVPTLVAPTSHAPIYCVKSVRTQQPRRYRMLRRLGQGTFSQVILAVRDDPGDNECPAAGSNTTMPPRLVAIKVVEFGPAGGADEERVEISLHREVEILKSVNHPSLVQLKAFGSDKKRALLVLDHCPGGDLFEFASRAVTPLSQHIIRRIFAELVDAVRYLHANFIVHRDIKLENVLVNIPAPVIQDVSDWQTYPCALVTLSDLGLSRRIPQPPESPLLKTRCGSEDYAAPEILMGQPYDGRSTDAWAMGVLLYAIMESRLPFDPLPGTKGDPNKLRARTPHRIARCEWSWYRFADENGEWDTARGEGREGARACVEGLLRKSMKRMSLDEIAKIPWVQEAINVPGGLKRGDAEVP